MANPSPEKRKQLPFSRKVLFTLSAFFIFILLATAVGEICVRLVLGDNYDKPILSPFDTAQKDELLGWKMIPGYHFDGILSDQSGAAYDVSIQYDDNGFKTFGDTISAKPKILFIGDSYTASVEVSNEKSFFKLIGDSLGAEVFAIGHAGYGTLQEYLVFDQWLDRIRPDLVVWGVCSNDFIDNYAPLEIVSGYKVGERRPYLEADGSIGYHRPMTFWQGMKKHLYFYQWLEGRFYGIRKRHFGIERKRAEAYIAEQGTGYPLFGEAVERTALLVKKIKGRLPANTAFLAYSAGTFQPQLREFERIFTENKMTFTASAAQAVKKETRPTKAADGYHWNERGHQLVADALTPFVLKKIGHPGQDTFELD